MRIIVRSNRVRLWLPLPLFMADLALFFLPKSAVDEWKKSMPAPYGEFVDKEYFRELMGECKFVLKQYRGLEIIHVEAGDGTMVSLRL